MTQNELQKISDIMSQLKELYMNHKEGLAQWDQEHEALQSILESLIAQIAPKYSVLRALGVGGTGVVLVVFDTVLEVPKALKFSRPKLGREILFSEAITSEISSLRQAAHVNIVEIYDKGKVTTHHGAFPFYIMEYIDKAVDAKKYFMSTPRDSSTLLHVLEQVVIGLSHLHGLKILHGDIKLENMLVSPNGRVVITDLGSARSIDQGVSPAVILFTRAYAHPGLISLVVSPTGSDSNRARAEIRRSDLKYEFDLYALGKNIFRILKFYGPADIRKLDPYTTRYIRLLAARLLDGHNTENECALGLPSHSFKEIKYTSINEVRTDISKVTSSIPLGTILPEMEAHAIRTIQISSLSPTPFTDRLQILMSHPTLRRLANVTQLGFINFVYPTSSHSRLEHMLGTLTIVVRYCDALYNDPINPLFRQIMNDSDLKALYLAALCHDLGQYPLAHDLEEAEPVLFSHETIGIDMLEGKIPSQDISDFLNIISNDWKISPLRIASIIQANPNNSEATFKDRILHTIIDGPIDADKIDYLVRDSENLNLPFGKAINFERLLQCLTIVFEDRGQFVYAALGIHEKGKVPAETVAFARYALFETAYWHHTSRAVKSMLHRAVWEALPLKINDRNYKKLKKSFISNVITGEWLQLELIPPRIPELPASTQLSTTDRDMIAWLSTITSPTGLELLRMILSRQLYKRLLVISSKKNQKLWDLFSRFNRRATYKDVVTLQKKIQQQVVNTIISLDRDETAITSAMTPKAIDSLIALHKSGRALILVDIPKNRPGSQTPLQYLPESDRREMLEDWKVPQSLEDSIIWGHLYDSFIELIGKIRIFCHPDTRKIIEANISKERLETIVEESLRSFNR